MDFYDRQRQKLGLEPVIAPIFERAEARNQVIPSTAPPASTPSAVIPAVNSGISELQNPVIRSAALGAFTPRPVNITPPISAEQSQKGIEAVKRMEGDLILAGYQRDLEAARKRLSDARTWEDIDKYSAEYEALKNKKQETDQRAQAAYQRTLDNRTAAEKLIDDQVAAGESYDDIFQSGDRMLGITPYTDKTYTAGFTLDPAANKTNQELVEQLNAEQVKQNLQHFQDMEKKPEYVRDLSESVREEQINDSKTRLEAQEKLNTMQGQKAANPVLYSAMQFGAGTASPVFSMTSGVAAGVRDALDGGKTSDDFQKISQYYAEHPEAVGVGQTQTDNIYGGRGLYDFKLADKMGVSVNSLDLYRKSEINNNIAQVINDEIGATTPDWYKNTLGQALYSIGAQVIPLTATMGTSGGGAGFIDTLLNHAKPSQALTALLKPNATTALMGASVAGSKYTDLAKIYGADPVNFVNALATGYSEALTENLGGFTDAGSIKKLFDSRSFGKNVLKFLLNNAEEAVEEVANVPLEGLVDKYTVDPDKAWTGSGGVFDLENMLESGVQGALVSALMGGPAAVASTTQYVRESRDARRGIQALNAVSEISLPESMRPQAPDTKNATMEDYMRYADAVTQKIDQLAQIVKNTASTGGIRPVRLPDGNTVYVDQNNDPTGTIPDIPGLQDAINKKWNLNSHPNNAADAVPRVYVQDAENKIPVPIIPGFDGNSNRNANQNASANVTETGRTSVDTDLDGHTPQEQKTIQEYQNAVDNRLLDFIQGIKNKTIHLAKNFVSSKVGTREANDILRLTDIDVSGFEHNIKGNTIQHILERHGENGKADQSLKNLEDIARIQYVIDNYDTVQLAKNDDGTQRFSNQFVDRNGKHAPLVEYNKAIDGSYYVIQAIPDSAAKKLQAVSAYIQQNKKRSILGAYANNGLRQYVQDEPKLASALIIPGFSQKSNQNTQSNPVARTQEADGKTISWSEMQKDSVSNPAKAFEEKYGIETKVAKPSTKTDVSAFLQDGKIVLNADALNTYSGTVSKIAHEATHIIQGTEAWEGAKAAALAYYKAIDPNITMKDLKQWKAEEYRGFAELDSTQQVQEVVAGFLEDICSRNELMGEQAARVLVQENPKGFRRITQYFKDKVQSLKAYLPAGTGLNKQQRLELQAAQRGLKNLKKGLEAYRKGNVQTAQGTQYSISRDVNGKPFVVIDNDVIYNANASPSKVVSEIIKKQIGNIYPLVESGQKVYIGKDLPGEYAYSKYTQSLNKSTRKTKIQASQNLNEMIEIATDRRWERAKHIDKHNVDAKYGFYKYLTRFAVPRFDSNRAQVAYALYSADLLIRNDANGKKYLYDVLNIKKESSSLLPTWMNQSSKIRSTLSNTNIPQKANGVNNSISKKNENAHTTQPINMESSRNGAFSNTNVPQKANGVNNSISKTSKNDTPYSYGDKPFSQVVDEIAAHKQGKSYETSHVYMGKTPKVLTDLGLNQLPMLITSKHIDTIMNASGSDPKVNYHGLGKELVKQIPEALENPVMVMMSNTKPDQSIVVLTTLKDSRDNPVISAIRFNGRGNYNNIEISANVVTSTYGKNSINKFIDRAVHENRVLYFNKQKSQQLKQTPGVQFPDNLSTTDFSSNIARLKEFVKREGTNNSISKTSKNDTSYSYGDSSVASLMEFMNRKYGTIPEGENAYRKVAVPRRTSEGTKTRQGVRTILEAKSTPGQMAEALKQQVVEDAYAYVPVSDKNAEMQAEKTIRDRGQKGALERWNAVVNGTELAGKETLALAEKLMVEAGKQGDVELFQKLAAEISAEATRAGQTVQAMRLIKKMTPEGQLYYLQKSLDSVQKDLKRRLKNKAPELEISGELAKELLEAKSQEEIDAAEQKIFVEIANQIPSTWMDKWDSWRYLAMLANPRTHIRNVLGNTVFVPARLMKNAVSMGIEHLRVGNHRLVKPENRTSAILTKSDKPLLEFAEKDFESVKESLTSSGKMNPSNQIHELRKVYKTGWLETLRKANNKALDAEDMFFLKRAYTHSMAQIIKARKLDLDFLTGGTREANMQLQKIQALATQEALEATYRDASAMANALNRFKNSNPVANVFGNALFAFTKTPINVLKRGVEYSPAGLIKGVVDGISMVRSGKKTATEVVASLSKALSGTGIALLGYWLASMNLLVAGAPEDDKEKGFEALQGVKNYALKIGDTYYTIDWMAPVALPLFVGAELHNISEWEGFDLAAVADSLIRVSEPMFNLSMLDGINGAFKSITYSKGNYLTDFAAEAALDYISQALPTLGSQIARTIDPTVRNSYYIDKTSVIPEGVQPFLNMIQSKIPGFSYLLSPKVDQWGRTTNKENVVLRAFENFISPGYISTGNETPVDKELAEIYEETGEKSVLPSYADKSFQVDGETYRLSSKEYAEYAQAKGQLSFQLINELLSNPTYQRLDADEKVEIIGQMYQAANAAAKKEINDDYDLPTTVIKAYEANKQAGILYGEYYLWKMSLDDTPNMQEVVDALNRTRLTKTQKKFLFAQRFPRSKNNPFS